MARLRKNPLTQQIPIIFITGKDDSETVTQVLSKKPDGYLLKSIKKKELLDRLDRFFAGKIRKG